MQPLQMARVCVQDIIRTEYRGGLRPLDSLDGANIWSSYSLSDISNSRAHTFDDAMTTATEQLYWPYLTTKSLDLEEKCKCHIC